MLLRIKRKNKIITARKSAKIVKKNYFARNCPKLLKT